jgi:hypothetical protein
MFEKKKVIDQNVCFDFLYNFSKNWARYDKKIYIVIRVKYPLFLSDFDGTWLLSTDFIKNI